MKKIAQRLTDLVGNTPLLELNNYSRSKDLKAHVIVKLEYFNPAGSVKDRTAAIDRIRNAYAVHIYDFFLKESGVATHDSLYLQAFIDSGSYNRTDCRIHSRGISAAGQYSDRSDFFL